MIRLIGSTFFNEQETKEKLCEFIMGAKQLSMGPLVKQFEDNLCLFQERKYAVVFNSGSSANLGLIQSVLNLGLIKKGDLAGFSATTWSTNVMPMIQLGLETIPVDVQLQTLNVSSEKLQETLSRHPLKMFFLTSTLGFCDDIDEIERICREKNILLLEDNCESLGTIYKGRRLGNFSFASTCSFYIAHQMSAVEGGVVFTDDENFYNMLKIVRAQGWDRNLSIEQQEKLRKEVGVDAFYDQFTFYDLAYNLRPTEITGFLGNLQLSFIDQILQERNTNFKLLAQFIYAQTDRFYPIKYNHIDFLSNYAFPIVCKNKKIKEELIKKCEGKVEIRPIFGGNILAQPFFKKYMPQHVNDLKNSDAQKIHELAFFFGNNPELTKQDLLDIMEIFK